jgi:hypothetical protein
MCVEHGVYILILYSILKYYKHNFPFTQNKWVINFNFIFEYNFKSSSIHLFLNIRQA